MEKRENSLVVSFSGSLRHINIDLNKLPSDYGKEEPQNSSLSINIDLPSVSGKKEPKSSVSVTFDLNEIPSDSEKEEPQIPPSYDYDISKNPPNSNSKPYTSRNKKRPYVQRKGMGAGYKKAKKLRREALIRSPPPTPEWLLQVNGAEDARLIYEKTLFVTDVNPTQSRLLISFGDLIRNDFLTQAESTTSVWDGMKKILINQRSEQWSLVLKIWVMKKKNSSKGGLYYALNHGWNDVVIGNGLEAYDKISLWSFRCQGALRFALTTSPATLGQSSSSATS